MSRLRKYTRSLVSGYVLLAANVVFTLASVPLALRYLSKAEFGLWATTTQLAGFIGLIDLGMSGVSRILIDYKDQKQGGDYGSLIQTTLMVSAVQAGLILVCGSAVALGMGVAMGVPDSVAGQFKVLMVGQSVLLAGTFLTRIFGYLLAAHQRYDIGNYSQAFSFVSNFSALWLGFHVQQGVFSMLWGQLAGWCVSILLCSFWCVRLRLFPPAGCWGRFSWKRFRELFAYGGDIFLFMLGGLMVMASQTILITRLLGLDATAIWSVCLRPFTLIQQVVYRVFDFSCAALAEMIVQQDKERLFRRFKSIVVMSGSLSVVAGVSFAICNQSFIRVWSNGEIGWPIRNDVLLAVWLVLGVYVRAHTGLVGQLKNFAALRYLFFLEGIFFTLLSLLLLRWGGITAMLAVSILASLLFTFPYGIWRTSKFFEISWKSVAFGWARHSLRLGMVLAPFGMAVWWLTRPFSPMIQLVVRGGILGVVGPAMLLRFGIEHGLQQEILSRSPAWLRSAMKRLGGNPKLAEQV